MLVLRFHCRNGEFLVWTTIQTVRSIWNSLKCYLGGIQRIFCFRIRNNDFRGNMNLQLYILDQGTVEAVFRERQSGNRPLLSWNIWKMRRLVAKKVIPFGVGTNWNTQQMTTLIKKEKIQNKFRITFFLSERSSYIVCFKILRNWIHRKIFSKKRLNILRVTRDLQRRASAAVTSDYSGDET